MNPFVFVLLFATTLTAYAYQGTTRADSTSALPTPSVKAHAHYDGIVSLSTNGKYTFFCLGGPSVGISEGQWRIAINFYPSLRIGRPEGGTSTLVVPSLGAGFYVGYKRAILIIPFHYITEERRWIMTAGLGWRITK
ncbi:hypothetical protein WBJ53_08170 [Spirosoma sp. SC4-14]|uniref:hypothetical protein n=1 Tax=Spirosoma sp. SC4-14 TaxID=3128900 RepID=UPI0030D56AFE